MPQVRPVRRSVDRALKAFGVNERLQQQQGVAKARQPIPGESSFAERQDARTEIRAMPRRQNQKTAVIGQQLQAVILMARVPTNPPIPNRAFPCRRGKAQQCQPLIAPRGDVP